MKALMTVKESDLAKLKHNLAVGKHIKLEKAYKVGKGIYPESQK